MLVRLPRSLVPFLHLLSQNLISVVPFVEANLRESIQAQLGDKSGASEMNYYLEGIVKRKVLDREQSRFVKLNCIKFGYNGDILALLLTFRNKYIHLCILLLFPATTPPSNTAATHVNAKICGIA